MVAQTSYNINTDARFHGSLADIRDNEAVTRIAEASAIGFGLAVSRGTLDNQAKLNGTGFLGITIRSLAREALAVGDPTLQYDQYDAMSILKDGAINLTIPSGGNAGDPLFFTQATGVIDAGVAGGARTGAIVADGGNTGDGAPGAVTPGTAAIDGDYLLECVEAQANAGRFKVIDPNGERLDDLTVAVAYSNNHFGLTIADGATDFVVGDKFTITIAPTTAGQVQIPGATLEETVAAGVVGLCRLSGQNA
jgi:hypothetical protein